jgi:hypothetical protein
MKWRVGNADGDQSVRFRHEKRVARFDFRGGQLIMGAISLFTLALDDSMILTE